MSVGLETRHELRGTYHLLSAPGEERPLSLALRLAAPEPHRLPLCRRLSVDGEIQAAGLATRQPVTGTLELGELLDARLIYDLNFEADDRRPRRMHGELELEVRRLLGSAGRVSGSVYEDDTEVARVLLYAEPLKTLGKMLLELRLRR